MHGFYADTEKKAVSFDIVMDFAEKHQAELAEKIRDMKLKVDTPVLVNLSFDYQEVTKDNVVRYFQRVRIEDFVPLAF